MNFNIQNKNVDSNYLSSTTFSHQSQLLVKHEDVKTFTSCTANIYRVVTSHFISDACMSVLRT